MSEGGSKPKREPAGNTLSAAVAGISPATTNSAARGNLRSRNGMKLNALHCRP
ncbi:hypothetical protein ACFQE0_16210 [Methylobacterium komagatae]|uniref:Uncharacterized protein n=1 Tax=Methylobacterium komagatae TaxID=374425 RepID=A0ABW2BLZ7_9HYPH